MILGIGDWTGIAGLVLAILGGAWKLLILPKHAQIGRLWDEVRRLDKELGRIEREAVRDFATKSEFQAALMKVETHFEKVAGDLGAKIDAVYKLLLERGGG